jgi:hypothetical protein
MSNKKVTHGRKSTPDIMGNLMGTTTIEKVPQSNKAIKQESNTKMPQPSINTQQNRLSNKAIKPVIKQDSNKAIINALKEKTTFNLPLQTLEILDDAWVTLRKKFKGEQRITKTLIVEKAIEIALADFESKSELSDLYFRMKK